MPKPIMTYESHVRSQNVLRLVPKVTHFHAVPLQTLVIAERIAATCACDTTGTSLITFENGMVMNASHIFCPPDLQLLQGLLWKYCPSSRLECLAPKCLFKTKANQVHLRSITITVNQIVLLLHSQNHHSYISIANPL